MQRSKERCYSITSSARASTVARISTPSVLPVCRLMTNWNLGRQLDQHLGRFLALEDAADANTALSHCIRDMSAL
jgi:hypothetical protein